MMIKRIFDIFFSLVGIIVCFPLFLVISLAIMIDSKGGVFFYQVRVGRLEKPFLMIKFRTMYKSSEDKGLLTVGRDARVTRVGVLLRRYKLDEIPQLINILKGEMSFVGPRPEVPKYVQLYNETQKRILTVKPGLTDFASIEFYNESELLEKSDNPEEFYIEKILPRKLEMGLDYIEKRNFLLDVKILWQTFRRIFK